MGRAYAAKVWPGLPVKVYSDPDLSAFRDDVYRPGYEALREAALDEAELSGQSRRELSAVVYGLRMSGYTSGEGNDGQP